MTTHPRNTPAVTAALRGPYRGAAFSKEISAAMPFRIRGVAAVVNRVARALWPRKADIELAIRTGASDRACRNWLAARCDLSADRLVELLRSDDGLIFLDAIFADAPNGAPAWWRAMRRAHRTNNVARALNETGARIAAARRDATT